MGVVSVVLECEHLGVEAGELAHLEFSSDCALVLTPINLGPGALPTLVSPRRLATRALSLSDNAVRLSDRGAGVGARAIAGCPAQSGRSS